MEGIAPHEVSCLRRYLGRTVREPLAETFLRTQGVHFVQLCSIPVYYALEKPEGWSLGQLWSWGWPLLIIVPLVGGLVDGNVRTLANTIRDRELKKGFGDVKALLARRELAEVLNGPNANRYVDGEVAVIAESCARIVESIEDRLSLMPMLDAAIETKARATLDRLMLDVCLTARQGIRHQESKKKFSERIGNPKFRERVLGPLRECEGRLRAIEGDLGGPISHGLDGIVSHLRELEVARLELEQGI